MGINLFAQIQGVFNSSISKGNETKNETPTQNPYTKSKFEIKTFNTANIGWGYDIYIDGKLYIHQPNTPAVSGNQGFKTEESARKTATLTVFKIKNNIMPPSISTHELDSLKVL